jgi:hypothetical protein
MDGDSFIPKHRKNCQLMCHQQVQVKRAQITIMVDADHEHCEVTRLSVSGVLVFINSTPVRWYSKMQKTVETSTYGSELVAARIATDIAMEFRYNIRMMGFTLDGPVNMFGDNQSVILNTTIPSSQLKKKIHACAYHRIREMITCRAIRFLHCHIECGRYFDQTIEWNHASQNHRIDPAWRWSAYFDKGDAITLKNGTTTNYL